MAAIGTLAALVAPASPAPIAVGEPNGPAAICRNGLYVSLGRTLHRFDEQAVRRQPVGAELRVQVNGLGFAREQGLFYAMADYRDGSHLVTIDPAGALADRGKAPMSLRWSHAGAIVGSRWLLRSDGDLMTVDVDPASPRYLKVTARTPLSAAAAGDLPPGGLSLGDWDVNPLDGQLYGIATGVAGPGRVVRIAPDTGKVATVATPAGLPGDSSFGAIVVDADGVLHGLHNGSGRMFHLPLDRPSAVTSDSVGPPVQHADAAGCPAAWDLADAPGSYGSDGATRHSITTFGVLTIGNGVGADPAGASLPVDGDDDDGLAGPVEVDTDASTLSVSIAVRNTTGQPALLAGWHDLNGDGAFSAAERATAAVPPDATTSVLTWTDVAVAETVGDLARLRLRLFGSTPDDPQPTGRASGGEIEDHVLRVRWPMPPPGPNPAPAVPLPARQDPPSPTPIATPPVSPAGYAPPYQEPVRPDSKLPITWTFFAGVLVPAIIVAARGAVAGRR